MTKTQDLNGAQVGQMTEADRLMDCLCFSKELAMHYARAALESANNGVREFFLAMHGEETHNQEILFSFLRTRGHYPVTLAEPDRIRETARRYRSTHSSLGLTQRPTRRRYHTADPKRPPAWSVEHPEGPDSVHP